MAIGKEPEPVKALPPHPLDGAFEKAKTTKEINEALLNNAQYKKAVAAALKTKLDAEKQQAANPKVAGPSPTSLARKKFIEVLSDMEEKEEVKK